MVFRLGDSGIGSGVARGAKCREGARGGLSNTPRERREARLGSQVGQQHQRISIDQSAADIGATIIIAWSSRVCFAAVVRIMGGQLIEMKNHETDWWFGKHLRRFRGVQLGCRIAQESGS